LVIDKPIIGDTSKCGRFDWAAERRERPKAHVVEHDKQNVGCLFRRSRRFKASGFCVFE
jgi:hypothetical protein